jgi:hypothetical protein
MPSVSWFRVVGDANLTNHIFVDASSRSLGTMLWVTRAHTFWSVRMAHVNTVGVKVASSLCPLVAQGTPAMARWSWLTSFKMKDGGIAQASLANTSILAHY